jgi:DNA polymerase-3 subunit gamma/tau
VSLYRRWRPKSFTDLVGQDAVVRTLRTALESGRLAHAYLFSGPRGSGKTSAAKILARCVDCVLGPTPEPDNTCEHCLAIMAGTALDVLEIDAASNRGIEDIRSLRESVRFAPAQMRMKVYILDEAHAITPDGANAFLKTLEEPPPHAIFILATTAPERLPATILSRCQRYAFRRIPIATMIERMRLIADAEGIAIDDPALASIAYRADGGLRDALTMLEQVAAFSAGVPVDAAAVDAAFGGNGRRYARDLVAAAVGGDVGTVLRVVDEASDAGTDMLELLRGVVAEQRNLVVARLNPALLSRDLSPEDAAGARAAANAASQATLTRGLRLFADALTNARFSPSPRLDLETAAIRLLTAEDEPGVEALAERVGALEAATGGPAAARRPAPPRERAAPPEPLPAPERAVPPPEHGAPAGERTVPPAGQAPPTDPQAAVGPPNLQRVRSLWQSIRTRVEGERKPLKVPLSRATVDAVEDGAVVISHSDPNQADILRDNATLIERAIADVLGSPLRVEVRVDRNVRGPQARSAHRAAVRAGDDGGASDPGDETLGLLDYASKTIVPRTERG